METGVGEGDHKRIIQRKSRLHTSPREEPGPEAQHAPQHDGKLLHRHQRPTELRGADLGHIEWAQHAAAWVERVGVGESDDRGDRIGPSTGRSEREDETLVTGNISLDSEQNWRVGRAQQKNGLDCRSASVSGYMPATRPLRLLCPSAVFLCPLPAETSRHRVQRTQPATAQSQLTSGPRHRTRLWLFPTRGRRTCKRRIAKPSQHRKRLIRCLIQMDR